MRWQLQHIFAPFMLTCFRIQLKLSSVIITQLCVVSRPVWVFRRMQNKTERKCSDFSKNLFTWLFYCKFWYICSGLYFLPLEIEHYVRFYVMKRTPMALRSYSVLYLTIVKTIAKRTLRWHEHVMNMILIE